jgi:hypothetical protein
LHRLDRASFAWRTGSWASPDYPGERLIVCRNPALAAERARKRGELLDATEQPLQAIQTRVRRKRRPLTGAAIGEAVGAVLNRKKNGQALHPHHHRRRFHLRPQPRRDRGRSQARRRLRAAHPGAADPTRRRSDGAFLQALATVERAFRSCKSVDLEVRPVFHWNEQRVRAHVFLYLLAYHLEWHMRQALTPILFDDTTPPPPKPSAARPSARRRSRRPRRKAGRKRTDDDHPVHSFRTLLADLATLTRNTVRLGNDLCTTVLATPTPCQHVFSLLGISPAADL